MKLVTILEIYENLVREGQINGSKYKKVMLDSTYIEYYIDYIYFYVKFFKNIEIKNLNGVCFELEEE